MTNQEIVSVDLFLFMGQSNMAGRGITCEAWPQKAPAIRECAGYEYRAVSDPDSLHPIAEPFGYLENRADGIDDKAKKTGSMVTAFVNAYYERTKIPVVAVSASKGGSSILRWQPGEPFLTDAGQRLADAKRFLLSHRFTVRHIFMLWCQGETDGGHGMSGAEYRKYFSCMWNDMKKEGVERCFLVRIGHYNGPEDISFQEIIAAQEMLPKLHEDVILVSRAFAEMKARGLMKDSLHYYQAAYNEVGKEAGENTAEYVMTRMPG